MIQCLYQTPPIQTMLYSRRIYPEQPLTRAFATFLNPPHKCVAAEKEACSNFGDQLYKSSPKFSNFRQHDNHDFFIEFLNILRSEERRGLSAVADKKLQYNRELYIDHKQHLTAVDEVFGGHIIAECICLICKQLNFICEIMLDISLPISVPTHQNFGGIKTEGDGNRYFEQPRVLQADTGQAFYRGVGNFFTQISLETWNGEEISSTAEVERNRKKPVALSLTECLSLYTLTERVAEGHRCTFCEDEQEATAAANAQTTPSVIKRTLIYDPPPSCSRVSPEEV